MRLIRFGAEPAPSFDRFGSAGFRFASLTVDAWHVGLGYLDPGGRMGRHPAVVRQLLAVLHGSGVVAGADGDERELGPGGAAVWEAGEEHETCTVDSLVAIALEGDTLEPVAAE